MRFLFKAYSPLIYASKQDLLKVSYAIRRLVVSGSDDYDGKSLDGLSMDDFINICVVDRRCALDFFKQHFKSHSDMHHSEIILHYISGKTYISGKAYIYGRTYISGKVHICGKTYWWTYFL